MTPIATAAMLYLSQNIRLTSFLVFRVNLFPMRDCEVTFSIVRLRSEASE